MIDTEILRELAEAIGQDAMRRILNVFLEELETQLCEILSYQQSGQSHRIEGIAHALKSTSATFGATELSQLALSIETASKNQKIEELGSLVASLDTCIQETRPLYKPYTDQRE